MTVLILGGTGIIGGTTALSLRSLGHEVTIAGRKPSPPPDQAEAEKYYLYSNGEAIPTFARLARDSAVRIFVNIGSYTHHVAPEQVKAAAYVRSRKQAADGVIAHASPTFYAYILDAPVIVGKVPDMRVSIFEALVNYTQGKLEIPPFAPLWGSNIMWTTALAAAAVARVLNNSAAIGGRAILLGDGNWTMAEYGGMFFKAVGSNVKIEASHEDHTLPRSFIFAGRNKVVYYV